MPGGPGAGTAPARGSGDPPPQPCPHGLLHHGGQWWESGGRTALQGLGRDPLHPRHHAHHLPLYRPAGGCYNRPVSFATLRTVFYNARYYDPVPSAALRARLGRFISADTLVPNPGNPQALNRYAYVTNNPLKYTDPSGHWLETVWDIANIAWDIHEIRQDPGNLWNWGALVVDVGAALLPVVPAGAGMVVHGGKAAKAAVEVASHADEAADALRAMENLSKAVVSLDRFRSVGRESIPRVLEAFGDTVRLMGEVPEAFAGRRVTTLGRTWDIEAAKELGDFRVLDDPNWSLERNYEWLMEAIEKGDVFYLASPVTEATLWNPKRGDVAVYLRELDLLLQVGLSAGR